MPDIQYPINDPTTPNLIIPIDFPVNINLKFTVESFNGATTNMWTPDHEAAICYYNVIHAINLANSYLNNKITHWAATNDLLVQPRAGMQLNAYYDRRALRFFYAKDPVTNNMVFSSHSSDVVLHEIGHAILDALRPDLFNVQAYEVWAFHESFGDQNALMNILHNDFALDFILQETNSDLNQSNTLTKLAEEMGNAIYHITNGMNGHTAGFLRNAFNGFVYTEPERLSREGLDNAITSEPHSFSRVFTGAWYEILIGMYNFEKNNGASPKQALITARNALSSYTFNAIANVPATIRFYDAFAKSMLVQDKINNYKYNILMNDVFIRRNILRQAFKPMASLPWMAFKLMLTVDDEIVENKNVCLALVKNLEVLSLPDLMINVAVPNDSYYEFDSSGECIETITTTLMELSNHARECVDFLFSKDMIRTDVLAPFEIDNNGNLIRSHFAGCCSCFGNCQKFGQPEFGKCWKQQNNAGCGCNGKHNPVCTTKSDLPKIIVSSNSRPKTSINR